MLSTDVGIYRRFSRFLAENNVHFYSQGISNQKSAEFITLAEAFQLIPMEIPENSVFVKMDIEQFEFRVLSNLLNFQEYINGLVIEFHDLDILRSQFVELSRQLKAHFEITHIHGNNYGGLILNFRVPKVLEITFLKKTLISDQALICQSVT